MKDTRILLVAKEGEARENYTAALEKMGVCFDVAASFSEVPQLAREYSYNGMLLDILTLVRTSSGEKKIAYDCINVYPSTRIKWDQAQGLRLCCFEQSTTTEAEAALEHFIYNQCKPFSGRKLRKFTRCDAILHVLLTHAKSLDDPPWERTFTVNISQEGCFIHMMKPLEKGQSVSLKFQEFPESGQFNGVVRWQLNWGENRSIPGVGVRFESLFETQAKVLGNILNGL